MMKSLKTMFKQDKEKYTVPKCVHDYIPVSMIWTDGIFKVGNKFTKTFKFADINYLVASKEDKESMFLAYSELLNSLDSGATTKLTINNHRLNKTDFEKNIKKQNMSCRWKMILILQSHLIRMTQNSVNLIWKSAILLK